ncbi:MAG: PTS sugar transporter subunit IIA [Fusobacteriaceae bacterium]|nr:PTS sugar transporter subunit IIA [Fusobacteriaceae bacterium]MBP9510842.1 PTS sugar transporter subunit IIA [Fusobacteriaceae bacterium]
MQGIIDAKTKIKEIVEAYSNEKLFIIVDEKMTKEDLLKKMVHNIKENTDSIAEENNFLANMLERENIGSTGIGMGVALPHARFDGVKNIVLSMALVPQGVEFETPDGETVKLVIMIGAPKEQGKQYLSLIAAIARVFRNNEYREKVISSKSVAEMIKNVEEFQ